MTASYRSLIMDLLGALEIMTPLSYRWFGVLNALVPAKQERAIAASDARQIMHFALKNRLYADFYCPGFASASDEAFFRQWNQMSPFLRSLSEANTGIGSRDSGWRVVLREKDQLVVERDGLTLWARPEQAIANEVNPELVTLALPKEHFRLSPGFYFAIGDYELPSGAKQGRYYWNLEARSAAKAIHSVSSRFNSARVPFRFKVVADPRGYRRTDAGVLYILNEDVDSISHLLKSIYQELDGNLKPRTPAFTSEIAPGLGYAESPADPRESFGTSRCDLLAEGLIRAYETGAKEAYARIGFIEQCFDDAGTSLDAPYTCRATHGET